MPHSTAKNSANNSGTAANQAAVLLRSYSPCLNAQKRKFPTIQALGFDPVWFGVVSVVLMEMGQITPPVGINVFAMSTAAPHVPMANIFRHIAPYFCAMLGMVFLLLLFPQLALWLPSVLL